MRPGMGLSRPACHPGDQFSARSRPHIFLGTQLRQQYGREEQPCRRAVRCEATQRRAVKQRQTGSSRSPLPIKRTGTTRGYKQAPGQKLPGTTGPGGWLSRFYILFTGFPFPLGPLLFRQTYRYEAVPGTMWTFEQMQTLGFSSVATVVRMTVIKLSSGGLWVHAPIAPTRECIALLQELDAPVEFIVLPTFAYEHKVFVAPFSRKFPSARVFTAPSQWTFPLPLPPQLLGIFREGVLTDDMEAPWAADIGQKVFLSSIGAGPYTEVAFLHKASKTLLVTDAVIYVSPEAPEVIKDGDLFAAGGDLPLPVLAVCNGETQSPLSLRNPPPPEDPADRRMLGWKRNALQVNFFAPDNLLQPDYSFNALANRVLVPPVLQTLVFSAAPDETRRWIEDITSSWDFQRIIPAHFAGPVPGTPQDLKTAFAFAFEGAARAAPARAGGVFGFLGSLFRVANPARQVPQLPVQDYKALLGIQSLLKRTKILNSTPQNEGVPQ